MDVVDFSANNLITPEDLQAPFLGFVVGSLFDAPNSLALVSLVGVTILQAYQYFLHYPNDSRPPFTTVHRCNSLLDFLHYAFSTTLMYSSFTSSTRYDNPNVLWFVRLPKAFHSSFYSRTCKELEGYGCGESAASGPRSKVNTVPQRYTTEEFNLILPYPYVPAHLMQLCFRSGRELLPADQGLTHHQADPMRSDQTSSVRINNIAKFPISAEEFSEQSQLVLRTCFKPIIHSHFVGFVENAIRRVCVDIYHVLDSPKITLIGNKEVRSRASAPICAYGAKEYLSLIRQRATCSQLPSHIFPCDGFIDCYVSNPSSVLYLAIEFSAPRLYANSILALFNSKSRLKERMDASTDLQIPSIWIFGDESPLPSNNQSQMTSSEGPSARADLVIIRQETTMSEK
ncbi:LOW QUALITY PROTEIN: hypothetical protein CVT26_015475 [Gymnopilus dilepis]|uniref:Uncharacterized protein n=1 Tax=Gymnopilus dilepis TaxID=231916 RepID=A0A409WA55_9AGAR|nr:LOW QUALITY PROTEIN: hypothetical protein CVT26_015475 [Gymnopilus dilepis]